MPARLADTRQRILDSAYKLFRRKGYSRVSVDEIAAAAKITKRSLYNHFDSKDRLLGAVLDRQHEHAVASFRTFGDKLAGDPARIIDGLFDDLAAWSSMPRWPGSGFTRLAFEVAELPGHPARKAARKHKTVLEDQFAELLLKAGVAEASQRAREIWIVVEGAMTLLLIHGDQNYVETARSVAHKILSA